MNLVDGLGDSYDGGMKYGLYVYGYGEKGGMDLLCGDDSFMFDSYLRNF